MRRCLTQVGVAVAAMSFSFPALAQNPPQNCPPGSWFCAEVVVPGAQPAPRAPQRAAPPPLAVEEPAEPEPAPPPPNVGVRRPHYGQPMGDDFTFKSGNWVYGVVAVDCTPSNSTVTISSTISNP